MSPGLDHGDLVLVNPARPAHVGAVVVASNPELPGEHLVKRVRSGSAGAWALGSDNPHEARDSRQFGSVSASLVVGPVTVVFTAGGRLARARDTRT